MKRVRLRQKWTEENYDPSEKLNSAKFHCAVVMRTLFKCWVSCTVFLSCPAAK